ncbi:MAG TPA: cobyric acid synthase [Acidimicrobiia bacterium]|nr:cobyric acid synthase [Acidimicrobiia bacterium]
MELRGALMVCGTTSDAGKTTLVTGLCRVLARRGVRVAPFKAQNMSLNSVVTAAGEEIGRAQGAQALAAGIVAEAAMNPILLKPTDDRTSQVVVRGRPWDVMAAGEYHRRKPELWPLVVECLTDLRERFDVVLCEGAGSPAEINLLDRDIVNLRVAHEGGFPAVLVGDIDPGGVFAALYGTVGLLPDEYRSLVRGFVINKLRGDPALLLDGCAQLRARTGVPTLGVLPWIDDVGIDAEDSLALRHEPAAGDALADQLDVVVVRFPRISNFTDLDPLCVEPGVRVRFVTDAAALGAPDLIVLPGTKATVADLAWLRERRLDAAVAASNATVLGICGGYQMLGTEIDDRVESGVGRVAGLGWLPVRTRFEGDKVTTRVVGVALGEPVVGYQIHHGRVLPKGGEPFVTIDGIVDGVAADRIVGTTVHGLLEADGFRRALLARVAEHADKRFLSSGVSFAATREARFDRLADLLEAHLDVDAVTELISSGELRPVGGS